MANGSNGSASNATTATQEEQQAPQKEQQSLLTGVGRGKGPQREEPCSSTSRGVNDLVADLCLNGSLSGSGSGSSSNRNDGGYGDYTNIRATTSTGVTMGNTGSSSSSFSFKHFLNSSGTVTAPTSTVTSVDATAAVQTSTGARPKVPQSASASLMQPPDANGSSASSKMKRSPRFSSFDSQASLAEYAACGGGAVAPSSSGSRQRPDLRLGHDDVHALDNDDDDHVSLAQVRNNKLFDERIDDDIFPSASSNLNSSSSSSRYVPRSYSSYDMPPHVPCPSSSPRRRPAGNRDLRPNRLVLTATPKMKLDLPLDTSKMTCAGAGGGGGGGGAAAALPDFVQDHLPDAWCAVQDAHLSSPPNSPLGAAEAPSGAVGGGLLPSALASLGLPGVASLPGPPDGSSGESGPGPSAGSTAKMLPDFLSDGPIIHSSQRLADVAIGLPSNSIDSPPQEAAGPLQLSTMRQENERLQRELQETRVELNAQTRRAHDFEQQLLQFTEASRRRETLATTANTQNTQRLRRQVAQLEAELFALRNATDGATGGATVVTPGGSSGSGTGSSGSSATRPSRTHQVSRDLRSAADNAEQNLRQLLTGVENLRQIAASLEQSTVQSTATPRSPDLYPEFN
ncbi:uncharacterized protein LOC6603410 [Drosophila persimilis]|uniref:uncharacterized protein LOC6603410 n=1 Tax=Drosophila persimilis TaxID=7234 RepID=UPI000F078F9A|nr:uncharacterized protein LOC6603410 [Drosophila persimilis]